MNTDGEELIRDVHETSMQSAVMCGLEDVNSSQLYVALTRGRYENLCVQIFAELCNNEGIRCDGGHHCCSSGCCLNSQDVELDKRYTYGYQLSIWNMWYFWFVILFLMMTCFGGCGYYKQRQRLMRGQPGIGRGWLSVFQIPPSHQHRETNRIISLERPVYNPENVVYDYSTGPITDPLTLPANFAPPPYTEVMNNPGLFPPNIKTRMPEYQYGTSAAPSASQTVNSITSNRMPQPPPYAEIENQSLSESIPINLIAVNKNTGQSMNSEQ